MKLKGDALRAETLRAGAHMLRLLHQDLYEEVLPLPNEVGKDTSRLVPELSVRKNTHRHLKLVTNRYNLNPQPKLTLFVEGKSEVYAIHKIFKLYYKNNPGRYGIEIIDLHGVDTFTGAKEDCFRAIFRLLDYLHSQQTHTFLILDNENYANKLKEEALKVQSTYSNLCYVTHPNHIRVWENAFEFDNFSCSEIAAAMNKQVENHDKPADDDAKLVKNRAKFTAEEVKACKTGEAPGSRLQKLYKNGTGHDLDKPELNVILVENMMLLESRSEIKTRHIMQDLDKIIKLARTNPLSVSDELAKMNQSLIILPENLN